MSLKKFNHTLDLSKKGYELREELTPLQLRYIEARILQQKTRKDALRLAGSECKDKNVQNVASEMEKHPAVKAYASYLEDIMFEELCISPQEIAYRLRYAYDLAQQDNNIREMRECATKLGELGGYIKGTKSLMQTNVTLNEGNPFSDKASKEDISILNNIVGNSD